MREMTRLYRCEPITKGTVSDWVREGQIVSGQAEAAGRWFVADQSMLGWYREDAPGPTRTVYVDVPNAELEKYRVANSTEQIGPRPVKSYSRDPENEFFLPRELAAEAKALAAEQSYDDVLREAADRGKHPTRVKDHGLSR